MDQDHHLLKVVVASGETCCRASEPHAIWGTMVAPDHSEYFLGFLCQSPAYQKASWTTYFYLMPIDYEESLPLFPAPLTKMSRCASAGDKWQQSVAAAEFVSWLAAIWRSPLALAKQYILDTAHRSDASSRRGVLPFLCVWLNWNSTFFTAGHLLRESHTDLSGGKSVTFTIVTLQDALGRVGSAVWTWKCGTEILRADVGA